MELGGALERCRHAHVETPGTSHNSKRNGNTADPSTCQQWRERGPRVVRGRRTCEPRKGIQEAIKGRVECPLHVLARGPSSQGLCPTSSTYASRPTRPVDLIREERRGRASRFPVT